MKHTAPVTVSKSETNQRQIHVWIGDNLPCFTHTFESKEECDEAFKEITESMSNTEYIGWSIEDILTANSNLDSPYPISTVQARHILRDVVRNHDANHGISWEEIEYAILKFLSSL